MTTLEWALVTPKQAAALAGVHRQTIYKWIRLGRCTASKTSKGQWLIDEASLTPNDSEEAIGDGRIVRGLDTFDPHCPDPEQLVQYKEVFDALGKMFNARDADIARRRIFCGEYLSEIGDVYGLSTERVRSIVAKAGRKLAQRARYTKGISAQEAKLAQDRARIRDAGPPPSVVRRRREERRRSAPQRAWTMPPSHHRIGAHCALCGRDFVAGCRVKTRNVAGVGYLVHALCERNTMGPQNPRPVHGRPGVFEDPRTGEQFSVKQATQDDHPIDVHEIAAKIGRP